MHRVTKFGNTDLQQNLQLPYVARNTERDWLCKRVNIYKKELRNPGRPIHRLNISNVFRFSPQLFHHNCHCHFCQTIGRPPCYVTQQLSIFSSTCSNHIIFLMIFFISFITVYHRIHMMIITNWIF